MDRPLRNRTRQLVGVVLVVVAFGALITGYANIRNETQAAVQMPYLLTGGVAALILTGLGTVIVRSQDDQTILQRLAEMEKTNDELRDRIDDLTQLLEAALPARGATTPTKVTTTSTQ